MATTPATTATTSSTTAMTTNTKAPSMTPVTSATVAVTAVAAWRCAEVRRLRDRLRILALQDETDSRRRLPDQQHRESDDEAHHKGRCGYHHDQVNGPRVVASPHKVEVTGPAFVSKYVKAHGWPPSAPCGVSGGNPRRPRQCPPSPTQDITFSSRPGVA